MTGVKTNERPGTRAVVRHSGVSAYKAREVLDLIRGQSYERATEILEYCDRGVAEVIGKLLHSAAANARHNDGIDPEETFVAACYADEGATLPRWRPRARGRATRIRKRTCHITVILSRLPEDQLARRRQRAVAEQSDRRARRVAGGRLRSRITAGRTTTPAGTEAQAGEAQEPEVTSAALAALEEARALESTSHHQELEAEAGAALEHEFHDHDDDSGEDDAADGPGGDASADSDEDDPADGPGGEAAADSDDSAAGEHDTTDESAVTDDSATEVREDETDESPSGDVVDDEPEVSPASASDDDAGDSPTDEES
jgi:large subunit ribosomal protein L22